MSNDFRWTDEDIDILLACETDEELLEAFPDKSLSNLKRRRRQFRSITDDVVNYIRENDTTPRVGNLKILLIDIETSPNLADVWTLWNANVGLPQLREASRMICWAAKWIGGDEVEFRSEFHDGTEVMLERVHALLSEADVVVHFNGNSFDIKIINKEFVIADMLPPLPSKHIDLYRVSKDKFRFPTHKLDHIVNALGIGKKVVNAGHTLWVGCMTGDAESWEKMKEYNIQDTILLEELYYRLRPWITNHPNQNLYGKEDQERCTNCNSENLELSDSYAYTASGRYPRYVCLNCGTIIRSSRRVGKVTLQQDKF